MADEFETNAEDETGATAPPEGADAATEPPEGADAATEPPEGAEEAPEPTPEAAIAAGETAGEVENLSLEDIGGEDIAEFSATDLIPAADREDEEEMRTARDLEAVYDIPVQLSAVLGRASMQVSQLLKLGRGAVVELDRKVGEAVDIYVNNRLIARGEVVVVEERLGVTMTEIIKSDRTG